MIRAFTMEEALRAIGSKLEVHEGDTIDMAFRELFEKIGERLDAIEAKLEKLDGEQQ